jgi:uncharacterized protein
MPAPAPLSDAQIEQLGDLLERRAVPFQGFNLEALDGFLSALAVGPGEVGFDEWSVPVWGPKPPRWENAAEAVEVEDLLRAHAHACVARARAGEDPPDPLMPLLWLPGDPEGAHPDELDIGRDWAFGFFRAVELREDAWDRWLDAEDWIEEIFDLLSRLAIGEVANTEPGRAAEPVSYRERLEIVASLPGMLADLYAYRIEQLGPRAPIRRQAVPERNAPCPCGSGRKYKKCCGS